MSDLIERLRRCEKYGKRHVGELCGEAADEIERLRAAIMRYKNTLAGTALLNFEKHFAREALTGKL
jgi:hypothetical protein